MVYLIAFFKAPQRFARGACNIIDDIDGVESVGVFANAGDGLGHAPPVHARYVLKTVDGLILL